MKGNGRMISRQDAAEILRTDPQTVSNWIEKGVLRGKMIGRIQMVDGNTIEALFDTLKDLDESKKIIGRLQQENYEKACELRKTRDEWLLDLAMVNGLEKPTKLLRMITSMIDSVSDDIMADRERNILKYYLDGSEFEAIGDEYGLTRERVRQIIEKAMRKLGSLEPYGDVLNRCSELENENLMLKATLKRQEAELDALRGKKDEAEDSTLSEQDRQVLELLNTRLVDMNLTVRALNCLKAADLETFADLVKCQKTDLLKFRNFGRKSLGELDDLLENESERTGVRFSFGMDVSPFYERYTKSLINKGVIDAETE